MFAPMGKGSQGFVFGGMAVHEPPEIAIESFAASGVGHVEFDLIRDHSAIESFRAPRMRNLKRIAQRLGTSLSLHVPYTVNPADPISSIRRANVEYLENCIEVAAVLGARHVTTHIGYCNGLPSWRWLRRDGLDRLVASLRSLLSRCGKRRVVLALENVNPMPQDSEFFYLGDSITDLAFLFAKVNSPWIRLCLDTGHANTNEGPTRYVERFKERIVAVHYHDNRGKYDEHLAVGRGTIDWAKLARSFRRIGYRGPFISEVFSRTASQSREDLRQFLVT